MAPYQLIEHPSPYASAREGGLPLWAVTNGDLSGQGLHKTALAFAAAAGFDASKGKLLLLPDDRGRLAGALFGMGTAATRHPFAAGKLARLLPAGDWNIACSPDPAARMALAFGMGAYRFRPRRGDDAKRARLVLPAAVDRDANARILAGINLARDLVNTPANEMGPAELEKAFRALAVHYRADVETIVGDDLLSRGFPMIHAVGRAAAAAPRLLELRWGHKDAPRITLVGKGVCFDTGGLDIKPSASMLLMKKDMGGAANVMALAMMIMDAQLPVNLRVLVPAVENSISANAFRPGDILPSRKGLSVQIDNTDAEGRLVLADALTLASEEDPGMLIDMATLTGAARVALGPELPPFYTDDESLASSLTQAALREADPIWRMPLYKPYETMLDTPIADLTNAPSGGFAGSITAALFLKRFVNPGLTWAHFDIYAWTPKEQPHAPVGGEAQAIRAIFAVLEDRYPA